MFKDLFICIVYVCVCLPTCMYTHHMHALFLWKSEGVGNPGTGIIDNYEQSWIQET